MEVGLFHIVGLAEKALLAVNGLRQIGESVDASLCIAQYYGDLAGTDSKDKLTHAGRPQKSPSVMSPARRLHA